MPDCPEAWYQQIGRAGRDGEPAETLLLYGGEDIARARHWLAQSAAPEAQKRVMRSRLESMIAQTETVGCRTRALLACFGEDFSHPCGHCDNCLAPPSTMNCSTEAQKLLSAVYRTGQIFGALHVIAVLRGEATEAVRRHRHDTLPTFGVGAARSIEFWRGLVRQLIAAGALDVDTAGHGGLFLVEDKARPILRGETAVMVRGDADAPRRPRRPASAVPPAVAAPSGLFESLRRWRAAQARAQHVPPYVIFHDSVLREIAAVQPRSLEELGQIKGVGSSRLRRYGTEVLAAVTQRAANPVASAGPPHAAAEQVPDSAAG
ncbi:MAG TPA: RQC domain-containing protein, partial [Acetobacteraceae bacterium]